MPTPTRIIPDNKPQLTKAEVLSLLIPFGDFSQYKVKLVGLRGYSAKSMGKTPLNEIGLYDDAFFIVSDTLFEPFNFNTDPSRQLPGIATLKPGGPYLYKKGIHGIHHLNLNNPNDKDVYRRLIETKKDVPTHPLTYWAFRQHGNVTIMRNGIPVTDTPDRRFYIDIHRGGFSTTSSEGCQTVPPVQWQEARKKGFDEMDKYNEEVIPYYLIEVK